MGLRRNATTIRVVVAIALACAVAHGQSADDPNGGVNTLETIASTVQAPLATTIDVDDDGRTPSAQPSSSAPSESSESDITNSDPATAVGDHSSESATETNWTSTTVTAAPTTAPPSTTGEATATTTTTTTTTPTTTTKTTTNVAPTDASTTTKQTTTAATDTPSAAAATSTTTVAAGTTTVDATTAAPAATPTTTSEAAASTSAAPATTSPATTASSTTTAAGTSSTTVTAHADTTTIEAASTTASQPPTSAVPRTTVVSGTTTHVAATATTTLASTTPVTSTTTFPPPPTAAATADATLTQELATTRAASVPTDHVSTTAAAAPTNTDAVAVVTTTTAAAQATTTAPPITTTTAATATAPRPYVLDVTLRVSGGHWAVVLANTSASHRAGAAICASALAALAYDQATTICEVRRLSIGSLVASLNVATTDSERVESDRANGGDFATARLERAPMTTVAAVYRDGVAASGDENAILEAQAEDLGVLNAAQTVIVAPPSIDGPAPPESGGHNDTGNSCGSSCRLTITAGVFGVLLVGGVAVLIFVLRKRRNATEDDGPALDDVVSPKRFAASDDRASTHAITVTKRRRGDSATDANRNMSLSTSANPITLRAAWESADGEGATSGESNAAAPCIQVEQPTPPTSAQERARAEIRRAATGSADPPPPLRLRRSSSVHSAPGSFSPRASHPDANATYVQQRRHSDAAGPHQAMRRRSASAIQLPRHQPQYQPHQSQPYYHHRPGRRRSGSLSFDGDVVTAIEGRR